MIEFFGRKVVVTYFCKIVTVSLEWSGVNNTILLFILSLLLL